MIRPWSRLVPTSESTNPPLNLRWQLDVIGKSVDWERFDKYFLWLDQRGEQTEGYPPIMLFKALLIQQWYAMTTFEYDYFLNDSISCRRFIGLRSGEHAPAHPTIASFRLLMTERGVASPVQAELDRQLQTLGLADMLGHVSGAASGPSSEPLLYQFGQWLRPPEWTEMETTLLRHWEKARTDGRMPKLTDINFSVISEVQPYAGLIKVVRDSDDFRYEFVGPKIVEGNDGDPTGTTIGEKQHHNLRSYGHGGLQSELAATYAGAVRCRRPVGTWANFVNAGLRRCEIWVTVAPLAGADDRGVEMLLLVALIKPILFN